MQTRRQLLARCVSGASLISLASGTPFFLPKTLAAVDDDSDDGRILVVVELAGGNDGINTVVPFRDEGYAEHRKSLRLPTESLLRIGDSIGLHPSMRELAEVFHNGQLAIVQGVGYPNPSRSHFRSMEVWHSGVEMEQENYGLGWVGKGLDKASSGTQRPLCMSVGQQTVPLALRGRRTVSSSVQRLGQYDIADRQVTALREIEDATATTPTDDLMQFVHRTHGSALQTVDDLRTIASKDKLSERYPSTPFGRQLRLTARLIRAGMKTRVFYAQQPGYDTHAGQRARHADLLRDLSRSLGAFLRDLEAAQLSDRVIVMAFSEFGRRVAENGSLGTDHGTAGPVFLAGTNVSGGLHQQTPSTTDLLDGDLKTSVDFRSIYANVLEKWLMVPSTPALGRSFEELPIVQG